MTAATRTSLQKVDAFALSLGSRMTVSTIMLGCVLAIVLGASSMLSSLNRMDRDLKEMSTQLGMTNVGLDALNKIMNSLPPTSDHLAKVVGIVSETSRQVKTSSASVAKLNTGTKAINTDLAAIATSTQEMRVSLESVSTQTASLGEIVNNLNGKIGPLAATQKAMLHEVVTMRGGMSGMNDSLAYVIRTLNYISKPPTGQGFMLKAELPKEALPPIPGVKVQADPVAAFPYGAWPIYTGP